jgi:hypothetical protein
VLRPALHEPRLGVVGPREADMLKGVLTPYRSAALRHVPCGVTQDILTEDWRFHRGPLTRASLPSAPVPHAYDAVCVASKAELADWAVRRGHELCLPNGRQNLSREHAFVVIRKERSVTTGPR